MPLNYQAFSGIDQEGKIILDNPVKTQQPDK